MKLLKKRYPHLEKEAKVLLMICQKNIFWHTVPKTIIYRYITDKALLKKVKALAENGKKSTTLFYLKDLFLNPLRAAYVFIHNVHYFVKYNKYR